mmetsp:Transcript_22469/g.57771  ORF Transcript_22469/g.57771 Transcript_22469/m.57771 type:complete len:296 (+) Transcript_22469:52-939(+)|eukprot:CAMPEP_0119408402 /NCGR_PEP_ID=MMETSP1335-20130426/1960_1 /TAXON_ID=259385 /ORGANISM="Chrysoculter rhomboideus, Strain RCC1486" /LENGTH=295 /DNA_ID=CAMNT_0007432629 /DNA_START=76 /DNA_END=963 /DNA_ORIENTATION=-
MRRRAVQDVHKVAVVSGASSGTGRATAVRLATSGWTVVAISRRAAELETFRAEVAASSVSGTIEPRALDLANGEATLAMARGVLDTIGVPDALVHCAGAGEWLFVEETSPAQLGQMINAPYLAAFHLTHAFMSSMLARRHGSVLLINSPFCLMPFPGAAGYIGARWALLGLWHALRMDLVGTGITATHVIFPEIVDEAGHNPYFAHNGGVRHMRQRVPYIGRLLVPPVTHARAARAIERAIRTRQAWVVHGWQLAALLWLNWLCGWLVRPLLRLTSSAQRQKAQAAEQNSEKAAA